MIIILYEKVIYLRKRYVILTIVFILIFSFSAQSENDISNDPDLRFYEALLLSWKGEYQKSEEKLLSLIEEYPERFDFYAQLARLYEWMGKPYNSLEYREKAYEKAKGTKYEKEYLKLLEKAREKIEPINFAEIEFLYENVDSKGIIATNFLLGQERLINNNINITGLTGINYKNNIINYLLRSEMEIESFSFLKNLSFKNSNNVIISNSKNKFDIYNYLDYKIKKKNNIAFNFNSFFVENSTNYQNLNLEYKHKWSELTGILGVTSRVDSSGFTLDFSQDIQIYYPIEQYLFNFKLSHYKGDEYVFRAGIEMTDIEINSNWVVKRLNGWINNKNTAKLDLRFEKK